MSVWQESVPGNSDRNYEIFFKKSSDDGNSFGEKIRLTDNIGFSEHPQMASENNKFMLYGQMIRMSISKFISRRVTMAEILLKSRCY